jgi:deoxycytidine triphosphate deaminase
MSVLSEWDIINELGKGIFIYPFNFQGGEDHSIRGCCLCLRASEYAYRFTINQQTRKKEAVLCYEQDLDGNKLIRIPAQKTAILWTNESVFLGNYLCGSLHSKVKLVSQGLGHIGTRVNPNYGGILAIALHNLSDEDILIKVGETIAYLRIHRLNSKSSFGKSRDSAGRFSDAIPEGCPTPSELQSWIEDQHNLWRKGDPEEIRKVLEASSHYQKAKDELKKKSIGYRLVGKHWPRWSPTVWATIIAALATIVGAIGTWVAVLRPSSPPSINPTPIITPKTQIAPTPTSTSVPK